MNDTMPAYGFDGYSVTREGLVLNDRTGMALRGYCNQNGVLQLGLMRDGEQHKRAVGKLVLLSWQGPHPNPRFDSAIFLDGNRANCHIDNLMWRPRWFAIRYQRQHEYPPGGFRSPVEIRETGERFPTSWDACVKYGLLDKDILLSEANNAPVWPIMKHFDLLPL